MAIRRTDRGVETDEMQSASAWILVKMLVEIEPCIQWNNLQLIYFSFLLFYQKHYQSVTPKQWVRYWSSFINRLGLLWFIYQKYVYSVSCSTQTLHTRGNAIIFFMVNLMGCQTAAWFWKYLIRLSIIDLGVEMNSLNWCLVHSEIRP